MNRENIIRMAREAGINEATSEFYCDELGRMLAAEREACAKVCETKLGPTATDYYGKTYAAAIRARGDT